MFDSEKSIYTGVNPKQPKLVSYRIFDLDLRAGNDYITIAGNCQVQQRSVQSAEIIMQVQEFVSIHIFLPNNTMKL
jgi:hypothetical protein